MQPFSYVRSHEPALAIKQLAGHHDAKFLAGGTNLLDFMKLGVESPAQLMDINRMPLAEIELTTAGVRIGALVRNSDLASHEAIRQRYPVLSEALLAGATPQVRNMATVGGNLMQRTRCTYFRDTAWKCNKRSAESGCSALDGYNRSHAILGTSDKCIATHPSDMCVALLALDAVVLVQGEHEQRSIPMADFHVAYSEDPLRETVLAPGELILAVELPKTAFAARSHYLKVRDRAAFEFALASVAAALEIEEGTIRAARIALGGVATKPWRAAAAETVLVGARPLKETFAAAAKAALDGAIPRKFNAFKIELTQRTIVRVLTHLAETG